MLKRLATSSHDPLGITDSACKNQSVVVSVQYDPFNPYIPIRSTTIGKSRVFKDPISMHTSWRSNSDIDIHACLRAVNPRQRCIDSYMHRGLTQSRRLMTPDQPSRHRRSGGRRRRRHHQRKTRGGSARDVARATRILDQQRSTRRRIQATAAVGQRASSGVDRLDQRRTSCATDCAAAIEAAGHHALSDATTTASNLRGQRATWRRPSRDVNARHARQGAQVPADHQRSGCAGKCQRRATSARVARVHVLEGMRRRARRRPDGREEEEVVILAPQASSMKIARNLPEDLKAQLIKCLGENKDIFHGPHRPDGGTSRDHGARLNGFSDCRPVIQKRRHFRPEKDAMIRSQVEELLKFGHIREIRIFRSDQTQNAEQFRLGPQIRSIQAQKAEQFRLGPSDLIRLEAQNNSD
ncbi:hypothetical protein F511_07479 [Dorcoceras hygrometricum]|uniref:Uncharacterized protein n=1 Tax=Dorcoceras hygrometricum TaxID=472368 RepID=A0A2Z7D6G9_9LAMI|nr:hypothetical protein F511_07479 [Dorcoceras hygrometricum]